MGEVRAGSLTDSGKLLAPACTAFEFPPLWAGELARFRTLQAGLRSAAPAATAAATAAGTAVAA